MFKATNITIEIFATETRNFLKMIMKAILVFQSHCSNGKKTKLLPLQKKRNSKLPF